jgi:hypothetical protein
MARRSSPSRWLAEVTAVALGVAALLAFPLVTAVWAQDQIGAGDDTTLPGPFDDVRFYGGFETGTFSEFGWPSVLRGTLETTQEMAVDGAWSAKGSLEGSPRNSFSRVAWRVDYESGQEIRYGASYFLTEPLPCWATLARWDNYLLFGGSGDVGGVELEDGMIRLIRQDYDGANFASLSPRVPVPVGRWFTLEVVQRLGRGDAYTDLYVDGELVGHSEKPNSRGRPIRHIRFGYVSVAPQCTPASTFFIDRIFAT